MKEIFLVGAGGMIGSISRMIILKLNIYNISLPLNTFLVNIIGIYKLYVIQYVQMIINPVSKIDIGFIFK